jgi:uracil-DNA glycosylase family 4
MFTGDSSGNFLYRSLHATGFASQATSVSKDDGLVLRDCYISAAARCAPPDNKPDPQELRNCRGYLEQELDLLAELKVIVALGRIAFDTYLSILRDRSRIASRSAFEFGHNRIQPAQDGLPVLISSYHPSQQNTSTGKLDDQMLRAVFRNAARIIARAGG